MVFIEDGTKLVTAGGEDGLIIVWKVNVREREREKEERGEVDEEKKGGRYDTSLEGNCNREREIERES